MAETKDKSVEHSHSDVESVTGELRVTKVTKPAARREVTVVFRQNRKFDLHVGREMVVFEGRVAKQIPVEWLQSPDFQQVAKYFVVKGV